MRAVKNFSKKILKPHAYEFVKDHVFRLAQQGDLPLVTRPTNESLFRSFKPGPWFTTHKQAVQIPPLSCTDDDNRNSGIQPNGRKGNGALYVGSRNGVRAEMEYYKVLRDLMGDPKVGAHVLDAIQQGAVNLDYDTFQGCKIFELRSFKPITMVSMEDVVTLLEKDIKIKSQFAKLLEGEPLSYALKSDDYSIPRGISHGVYQALIAGDYTYQDLQGVQMESARSGYTPKVGDNLALFDNPILTPSTTIVPLDVIREIEVLGRTPQGKTRISIKNI